MTVDSCERSHFGAQRCEPKQLTNRVDDIVSPPSASLALNELFDTGSNNVGSNGSYNDTKTRELLSKAEISREPGSKFFDNHYDHKHALETESEHSLDSIPMACRVVKGASILLVSLTDDGLNLPCVLLAREKKASWLNNSNTHIYTDFGGSANDMTGRSPEYIAARELVEESAGVLRYFDNEPLDHVEHLQDNIEASLLKGEYLAKFETPLNNRQKYVTFVKQVPWQPRISHLFQQTRKLLTKAQADFSSLTESDKILVKSHPAVNVAADTQVGAQTDAQTGALTDAHTDTQTDAQTDKNVKLNKAFFEKSDLKYFSLAFVQYYLDTGETHIVDSFKCMAYFKGRLRSATQIVGHVLQEAELLRLPPKFSTPHTTTSNMLSEEKPLSFKPKAKPSVVFVAGTPATGLDFGLVKNGIGNSQWRWKPKQQATGDKPKTSTTSDTERRRRRSEREHDNQRFCNGPLRSITERIGIDNKLRWTTTSNSASGSGRNVWGKRDDRQQDYRQQDYKQRSSRFFFSRPAAGSTGSTESTKGTGSTRPESTRPKSTRPKSTRPERVRSRNKPQNRFFDRHGKSEQQWRRR
jgi:hypothetical protein